MAKSHGSADPRPERFARGKSAFVVKAVEVPHSKLLALYALAACLLLGLWAYWSTLAFLVEHWDSNPDYSHGYLIIPIASVLLWLRRDAMPPVERWRISWAGLSLLALAAVMRITSARLYYPEVDGWSIVCWVAGVVWFLGGWELIRWAWPSVAFLLFMIPLPATIELMLSNPLRRIATGMSSFVLQCLGQPAITEGTTILLNDVTLDVERACSGLRMFFGILAVGFGCILVLRPRLWIAVALLASVFPVALVANTIRLAVTGLLFVYTTGETAQRFSHDIAGWLMIPLALALFCLVFLVIKKAEALVDGSAWPVRKRVWATAAAVLLLIPAIGIWHSFQQTRNRTALLDRATSLEEKQQYAAAAMYLERYVRGTPDDPEVLTRLARTVDRIAVDPATKARALRLYDAAAAASPEQMDLQLRRADLAVSLGRFAEAHRVLDTLLAFQNGSTSRLTNVERAEALRLKAMALMAKAAAEPPEAAQTHWQQAIDAVEKALAADSGAIELYVQLAAIYRQRLTEPDEGERRKLADAALVRLIEANQTDPRAWLARYRFWAADPQASSDKELLQQADEDLDQAIALVEKNGDQGNSEVLLEAGQRARRRQDPDGGRKFFERGIAAAPQDYRGYVLLANLESAQNEKESRTRAVSTLKQGLARVGSREVRLLIPLATALSDNGQFQEAETYLAKLDELQRFANPEGQTLIRLSNAIVRAEIKANQGQIDDGIQLLQTALANAERGPKNPNLNTARAKVLRTIAQLHERMERYDQVATALKEIAALSSDSETLHLQIGAAEERVGRFAEAVGHYRQAANSGNSETAAIALARGELLVQLTNDEQQRDWKSFQAALAAAAKLNADPVAVGLLSVEYRIATDQPDEAIKLLEAMAKESDDQRIWQALALAYQRIKSLDKAEESVQKFAELSDDEGATVLLRATVLSRAEQVAEAIDVLEKGLDSLEVSAKQERELVSQLALLELQLGRRAEARQRYEKLLAKYPNDLWSATRAARLACDDQDWPSAERLEGTLRKIEGASGTEWRACRVRRLTGQSTTIDDSRFREAKQLVSELMRLRPDWSDSHLLSARIARFERRLQEALLAYQQADRLGEKSLRVAEEMIELSLQLGRFAEAEQQVARVREYVEQSTRLTTLAIPIHLRKGEISEARQLAEEWVRRHPGDHAGYLRLGQTLLLTTPRGTPETESTLKQAEQALLKAVELAPEEIRGWIALFNFYRSERSDETLALKTLERLAEQRSIPAPQRVFVLAQLFEAVGNREQASKYYEEAAELAGTLGKPAAEAHIVERAGRYFAPFDRGRAEALARRALKLAPTASGPALLLVQLLADSGKPAALEEAFEIIQQIKESGDASPGILRLEALLLANRGNSKDRKQAIEHMERLVQLPNHVNADDKVRLALLYEQDGRILPAYEQLTSVAYQKDATIAQRVVFAEFLYRQSEANPQFLNEADRILAELNSLEDGRFAALRTRLAWLARDLKERDNNRTAITQLVDGYARQQFQGESIQPAATADFQRLLMLLAQLKLGDEAIRIAQGSGFDPTIKAGTLATVFTVSDPGAALVDEARQFANKVLQSRPADVDLRMTLATLELMQRNYAEAVIQYRKLLSIKPDAPLILNNLAIALAADNKTLEEAAKTIQQALTVAGPMPELLDTQAVILLKQGRGKDAVGLLEKVTTTVRNPSYQLHLAFALHSTGDTERARQVLDRAMKLGLEKDLLSPEDRDWLATLRRQMSNL